MTPKYPDLCSICGIPSTTSVCRRCWVNATKREIYKQEEAHERRQEQEKLRAFEEMLNLARKIGVAPADTDEDDWSIF